VRVGRYRLSPEALRLGEKAILAHRGADVIFVDEFGPLEMSGGGYRTAFDEVIRSPVAVVAVVRRDILPAFLRLYGDDSFRVFEIDEANRDGLPELLAACLRTKI
jgi:nucleoside-triphosphatase THEP1